MMKKILWKISAWPVFEPQTSWAANSDEDHYTMPLPYLVLFPNGQWTIFSQLEGRYVFAMSNSVRKSLSDNDEFKITTPFYVTFGHMKIYVKNINN